MPPDQLALQVLPVQLGQPVHLAKALALLGRPVPVVTLGQPVRLELLAKLGQPDRQETTAAQGNQEQPGRQVRLATLVLTAAQALPATLGQPALLARLRRTRATTHRQRAQPVLPGLIPATENTTSRMPAFGSRWRALIRRDQNAVL